MTKLPILTIIFLTASMFAFAQNPGDSNPPGARETMLKFVELNNKQALQTDAARLLLGEPALRWDMTWFGEISGAQQDKIVSVEKNFSVARVQTVQKNSRVVDLYFYLRFDHDLWTIRQMRAMAQTGWLESIVEAFKNKPDLSAEEKEILANTELVLSTDKTLIEWFQKNRLAFDNLAALALVETKPKPEKVIAPKIKPRHASNGRGDNVAVAINPMRVDDTVNYEPRTLERISANEPKFPKSAAIIKNLHLTSLETKADGSIEIIIGGVTDNTVGFVYSPQEKPPQIDGWRFIWVEKLAAGWYLFRTT